MLVNLNPNTQYVVSYRHHRENGVVHSTECFIKKDKQVIAESHVSRHHEDQNNVVYARKVALEKALEKLNLSKTERKEFWDQIWNQMRR